MSKSQIAIKFGHASINVTQDLGNSFLGAFSAEISMIRFLLLTADRSTVLPPYVELILSHTGECFFGAKNRSARVDCLVL